MAVPDPTSRCGFEHQTPLTSVAPVRVLQSLINGGGNVCFGRVFESDKGNFIRGFGDLVLGMGGHGMHVL